MSFRAIFVVLNLVLVMAFAFIVAVPILILGPNYAGVLRVPGGALTIWLPVAVFGVALVFLNGYFVRRWRLFTFLDARDWAAAADYLSERVLQKRKVAALSVRLLANTLLLSGRIDEIRPLEVRMRALRPRLHARFILHLSIPYLLVDPEQAVRYFAAVAAQAATTPAHLWLLWDYAFALIRCSKYQLAADQLLRLGPLLSTPRRWGRPAASVAVISLLRSYAAQKMLERPLELAEKVDANSVDRALERLAGDPQVLVFGSVVREARAWLATTK